jgi:hypothetical protein
MTVTLFKDFAPGMSDYIVRHKSNYGLIESNLNQIIGQITGQTTGGLAVPLGLQEIFDRPGLIGVGSYDFTEGVLSGPNYLLAVSPGAYWSGSVFLSHADPSYLSFKDRSTGTCYIYLDGSGVPGLSSNPTENTVRTCHWDNTAKAISAKTIYTGVSILFDGDDYQAMRGSHASVGDRLAAIEAGGDVFGGYYSEGAHDGLNFHYNAGKVRNDSVVHQTAAGYVTLADNNTNYVEVNPDDGVVSANTTGYTSGRVPLYKVVTAAGSISSVTDDRTPAIFGAGGGGGAGHTQNTDIGTTAQAFRVGLGTAGQPTGRAGFEVDNGDDPAAMLKFNRDTGRWEYTEDGGASWRSLGDVDLELGAQEFTKFVALDNPPEVFFEPNRGASLDWETIDLTPYLGSPQFGVRSAVLRVFFRDAAPGLGVHVMLRQGGGPFSPTTAFTVWSDDSDEAPKPATLVIPVNLDHEVDFWVEASGADTATLQVFLLGFYEAVHGVGTQVKAITQSNINVAANSHTDVTINNFCKRGLAHYLKAEETSGTPTGLFDVEMYADAALTRLLYKAINLDPAAPFEDWLPFWVFDHEGKRDLRLRVVNKDTANAGVYTVTVEAEQFA